LQLVGPYDVLAGKTKKHTARTGSESPNYLRHWRYYYDPPEFLTVVRGDDKKQFHIGYYRYIVAKNTECRLVISFYCCADLHCLQCFDAVGWVAGRASGL